MINKNTLSCKCGEKKLEIALHYTQPPLGELTKIPNTERYERSYLNCKDCGHFFSKHEIDLEKIYEKQYLENHYGNIGELEKKFFSTMNIPLNKSDNKNRILRIHDFLKSHNIEDNRLLDVGAGIGVFGEEMSNNGWDVFGTELDELMVKHLNINTKLKAYHIDLTKVQSSDLGLFDLITLNKVLEHISNPLELLKNSLNYLKKSGFIYIEVPHTAAINDGSDREEFYIDHHHVFSVRSAKNLLLEVGMRCMEIKPIVEPSGKYTVYCFAKFA